MWARMSSWCHNRRRPTRIFLVMLTVVVCLGTVYWGTREQAIRVADHVTITVTRTGNGIGSLPNVIPDGPAGSIVYQHTFGRALAAEAEHLLNDETVIPSPFDTSLGGSTLDGGHERHYHLAFTWHGILVETVDVTCEALPEYYTISALGLVAPWQVRSNVGGSPYGSVIQQLSKDSGGAIPPITA